MMLDHFAPYFTTLSIDAVHFVSEYLKLPSIPSNGDELFEYCSLAGLSHADVVVPLVRDLRATPVVEALIGRPITRRSPPKIIVEPTKRSRTTKSDPRIITYIHPQNPKKPGTRAARIWDLYRVGMTVDEYVAAGGRRSAIRYDDEHGFIQLAAADRTPRIKSSVLKGETR
jgi:hypothetical protein